MFVYVGNCTANGDAIQYDDDESVCPLPLERKYVSEPHGAGETILEIPGTGCAAPCWAPLPHTEERWLTYRSLQMAFIWLSLLCCCITFYYQYSKSAGYENLIPSFVGSYIYMVSFCTLGLYVFILYAIACMCVCVYT